MIQEKFKEKTIVEVISLILTLLPTLTGNFLPQVNATPTGNRYIDEITSTLPDGVTDPQVLDVDSTGRVYLGTVAHGCFYSDDLGVTWTRITAFQDTARTWETFIDSNDYVYMQVNNLTGFNLYRSIDRGVTWTDTCSNLTVAPIAQAWHIDADSSGNIYFSWYTGNEEAEHKNVTVWRSTDNGVSFSLWYNLSDTQIDGNTIWGRHTHSVRVAPNDYVYLMIGDADVGIHGHDHYNQIRRYNGTGWEILCYSNDEAVNEMRWCDAFFLGDYIYGMPDLGNYIYRMRYDEPNATFWSSREKLLSTQGMPDVEIFDTTTFDNFVLCATEDAHLLGTWDGIHYVKIHESSGGYISRLQTLGQFPFYWIDYDNAKVYRLNRLTKEDLINLYYEQFNSYRGSVSNAATYITEHRLSTANGTSYVDLTDVALTNVQASIKGLSKTNHFVGANAGFEWGNTTGYTFIVGGADISVTSESGKYHDGSYGLEVVKEDGEGGTIVRPTTDPTVNVGDYILWSVWYKANDTATNGLQFQLLNMSGGANEISEYASPTTSWQQYTKVKVFDNTATWTARPQVKFNAIGGKDVEYYIDSVLVWLPEASFAMDWSSDDLAVFMQTCEYAFFDSDVNTINATLTVNGETVSHSGTLTNGTESNTTSLSGILTGALEVGANIQGSGQAILKLNGTRVFYGDSIILKGRTQNVYYGRYYGMLSLTINTTDLLALTNLQANIASLSFDGSKLTLFVHSPSGTTSTSKVYCGDKGEPPAVYATNGILSWSYNASTKMLTLNVVHEGPANILVDWRIPGDVNGDGIIDIFDIGAVSAHWYPGPPIGPLGYDADCDINNDGAIDLFDICICCDHWTETC